MNFEVSESVALFCCFEDRQLDSMMLRVLPYFYGQALAAKTTGLGLGLGLGLVHAVLEPIPALSLSRRQRGP